MLRLLQNIGEKLRPRVVIHHFLRQGSVRSDCEASARDQGTLARCFPTGWPGRTAQLSGQSDN